MSFIIDDNKIIHDSYSVRGLRFDLLSNNINQYASELDIEASVLSWAENASAVWDEAYSRQTFSIGAKAVAYDESQKSDAALFDKYKSLKKLLLSRYGGGSDVLRVYGADGVFPRKRDYRVLKAFEFADANDVRLAMADPKALPQAMTDELRSLAEKAVGDYENAREKLVESKEYTVSLKALYAGDGSRLSALHSWILAVWGKYDLRLIELGFARSKKHVGDKLPAPGGFSYDADRKLFTWADVDGATSYRVEKREGKVWSRIYFGRAASAFYEASGPSEFRVQARNARGYGKAAALLVG